MGRMIVVMGILLMTFVVQACGQARTRTRTGGYPKWDMPAGAALERSFRAPVKTADPTELAPEKERK
ncbi:MAG: hypothetical protein ACE5I9_05695 [Candidatus Methylomirabilales bacterium]